MAPGCIRSSPSGDVGKCLSVSFPAHFVPLVVIRGAQAGHKPVKALATFQVIGRQVVVNRGPVKAVAFVHATRQSAENVIDALVVRSGGIGPDPLFQDRGERSLVYVVVGVAADQDTAALARLDPITVSRWEGMKPSPSGESFRYTAEDGELPNLSPYAL
jgi:hypothetical protein